MNKRIQTIILRQNSSIREAMEKMQKGPHCDPPAPWGIVLIVDKKYKLIGIVTDGDIRRALLRGHSMRDSISEIISKNPLSIRYASNAGDMLSELNEEIRKRNAPDSKFHNIIVVDRFDKIQDVVTPFELWKRSEIKTRNAAVIGLGYVGLTLALTLNEFGIKVFGIDNDKEVLRTLKRGKAHFYEKGLDNLLKKHINKNLFVKSKLSKNESDIYIICVGTPIDKKRRAVTSYLGRSAASVGRVLKVNDLVILRSTVTIGISRNFVIPILEKKSGLRVGRDFFVAFAPERTVEGRALEELFSLPQIIGGYNKQSLDHASQLFQLFANTIVSVSSLEAAESIKLLNNTFRDVIFSFSNEVAQIFDAFNLNTLEIIRAANKGYPRDKIPLPSPGVGGACLVKDPFLLIESAKKVKRSAKIPQLARAVNMSMIDFVYNKVNKFCVSNKKNPKSAKIFIMGIAFKGNPETSDIRDSTSVDILQKLRRSYKNIFIYDPIANKKDLRELGVGIVAPKVGFKNADCVLILNNHPSYRNLDIYTLATSMNKPSLLFDGWAIYTKKEFFLLEHVTYDGLGVDR